MINSFSHKILAVRTRAQATSIVKLILNHSHEIEELMECFFSEDWVLCQKSSWPLSLIAEKVPEMIAPYMPKLIENLKKPQHDAVIRNTIRAWQMMEIPEEYEGQVYDKCFEYFADPIYAIAIRVFAMTVCTNIAMKHHALAEEIIPVIEENWDHTSAAWRSRGKYELKRLRRLPSL